MNYRHKNRFVLVTMLCAGALASIWSMPGVGAVLAQQSQPAAKPRKAEGPERWESAIAEFEKWDAKNTPPRDAVLFVGSSSMVMWKSAKDFAEYPIINRGFGGSEIEDSTFYAERIIAPYKPRVIVFYAGDNDTAAGKSVERIHADFDAFVAKVRSFAPPTPIVFLSIKPSRSRWHLWPVAKSANEAIEQTCKKAADGLLQFVDVATVLLDKGTGEPIDDFFVSDKLHLSSAGYAKWNEILRPELAKLMTRPDTAPVKP